MGRGSYAKEASWWRSVEQVGLSQMRRECLFLTEGTAREKAPRHGN